MNCLFLRNIVETIEQLEESTGLAGRKSGDTFTDQATGDTLIFNDIKFFPEEGGSFTGEQLDSAIKKIESQLDGPIQWENNRGPRTGAFAIASFGSGDENIYVGTYLQSSKANFTDNYIPNTILKKYKFAGKAAAKTQAGLTPQDLLSKRTDLTISDIMQQLAEKLTTDSPLYHIAHHVAIGQPLPMEIRAPEGISFTAFRDYFCEILQPIALQRGLYTGNAGEAADIFLSPEGFERTKINFDSAKNAGLADSTMELSDGRFVKISSKGSKGADASVKNLADSIENLSESPSGQKIIKKYKTVVDLVNDIQTAGQSGAPLFLGVKYDIITSSEAQIIRGLKNNAPVDISDVKKLKEIGLTKNLAKLVADRATKSSENTNLYYHLMASVAHKVADYVNRKTDFSDAAGTILNNGALVQVYTKAKERGDKWVLSEFETVYPGTSVTGVEFSAQKNYSSTSIKGNFTFKILRGGAKVAPEDNTDEVPSSSDAVVTKPKKSGFNPLKDRPEGGAGRSRRK